MRMHKCIVNAFVQVYLEFILGSRLMVNGSLGKDGECHIWAYVGGVGRAVGSQSWGEDKAQVSEAVPYVGSARH